MTAAARTTLLAAALSLAACGDAPGGSTPPDGARLYVQANCTTCHGKDGAGGALGPALRGLDAHWTRETLADYMADPKGAIERDPRMRELSKSFRMHMPPVTYAREHRLLIADHALALSAAAK